MRSRSSASVALGHSRLKGCGRDGEGGEEGRGGGGKRGRETVGALNKGKGGGEARGGALCWDGGLELMVGSVYYSGVSWCSASDTVTVSHINRFLEKLRELKNDEQLISGRGRGTFLIQHLAKQQ